MSPTGSDSPIISPSSTPLSHSLPTIDLPMGPNPSSEPHPISPAIRWTCPHGPLTDTLPSRGLKPSPLLDSGAPTPQIARTRNR